MTRLPANKSRDPRIRRLANALRESEIPSATGSGNLFLQPGSPPTSRQVAINDINFVTSGTAARAGTAVLVAGTVTVNSTAVGASARIMLTTQIPGGTVGAVYVSARVNGTSFTITSTSLLDTSTVAWEIH